MANDDNSRIEIGSCAKCGRRLRVKPRGIQPKMRLTCKCGHVTTITIDQTTLSRYGAIKPPVIEDAYQTSSIPLYRLLDGPRLKAKWAEVNTRQAEKWRDLPRDSWPPASDIISVSMNPYAMERNARQAMSVVVQRVKTIDNARPWSVELYQNIECSIAGLLDAPWFVFLGMTEMLGCTAKDSYNTFKQVVGDLRTDDPRAKSGGEWEIWSQSQGNRWRGDRCAKLLERWVFLDVDVIQTFNYDKIEPFAT